MTHFIQTLISGLSLGSIYALIALGYTMVYGIAKMLNFAHGDIIMIGAYSGIIAVAQMGLPPLIAVLLSILICAPVSASSSNFWPISRCARRRPSACSSLPSVSATFCRTSP